MPVPIITVAQMREWEAATWRTGTTEAEVIRRVGDAVAKLALRLTRVGARILVLVGKGHNGDDARAAGAHLSDRATSVLNITDPEKDLAQVANALAERAELVIDGLFGIGLNRPLSASWVRLIETLNEAQLPVLAVDVPSGLNAESGRVEGAAVRAATTLTVGAPKAGLMLPEALDYMGALEVAAGVGLIPCPFTNERQWVLSNDFFDYPPPRPVSGHKGTFGHLVIFAGSLGYHGASILASKGALRARPGLVSLFCDERVYIPVAGQSQAIMVHPWRSGNVLPSSCSAILIGPGLAAPDLSEDLKAQVRGLWQESPLATVVDASALNWLPAGPIHSNALRVITPHPGEAARLLDTSNREIQADRFGSVRKLSAKFANCWVVLKGHQTLIGRGAGEIFVNSSGNPYLAQGGSGDALGGFLAGLLAQPALQSNPTRAICYAVWQHGATADHLSRSIPNWTVEDLVVQLGSIQ